MNKKTNDKVNGQGREPMNKTIKETNSEQLMKKEQTIKVTKNGTHEYINYKGVNRHRVEIKIPREIPKQTDKQKNN